MTPQQLIGIAVRLFAVWLVMNSVAYLVAIPGQLSGMQGIPSSSVAVSYALAGLYLIGAAALWFFPMLVAHRLLPRTSYENRLEFRAQELARVGCALFGLWIFAKSLPTLAWFFFRAFLVVGSTSSFSALDPQGKLDIAVAVFGVALGAVIIWKSAAFARIVAPEARSSQSGGEL
jgi:hypothetical protein